MDLQASSRVKVARGICGASSILKRMKTPTVVKTLNALANNCVAAGELQK